MFGPDSEKQRERKINQNDYFLKVYEILVNEPTDTWTL